MSKSIIVTIFELFGWKIKLFFLIIISCIFLLVFFMYNGNQHAEKRLAILIKEGLFSIGEVDGVTYGVGVGTGVSSVMYFFYEDNKKYDVVENGLVMNISKKAKEEFMSFDKSRKGEKFLVIYEKNNPKNAVLCLDKPIKDSLDFKKYVIEFEKLRKETKVK